MASNNRLNYNSDDGKTFNVGGIIQMQPGAKLLRADGFDLATGLAPALLDNTAVIFGDSETSSSFFTSSVQLASSDYGYWPWVQAFTGHAFNLLNNAGVGGDTTTTMLARISNDVLRFKPSWVFMMGGTNDTGNPASIDLATTKANLTTMYNMLLSAGVRIVACAVYPRGSTGYTAASVAAVNNLNLWIRNFCLANKGMIYADTFTALVDPLTATGYAKANYLRDFLHTSALGARAAGRAIADAVLNFITPSGYHASSNADNTTFDASSSQVLTNSLFSGSAGAKTGVASGTVADNWTAGFAGTDLTTSVCSVVARTVAADGDTIGNNQRIVAAAASSAVQLALRAQNIGTLVSAGDRIYFEAFLGAKSMTNVAGIQLFMFFNTTLPTFALNLEAMSITSTAYDQTDVNMVLRTPTYTVPAGTNGTIQPQILVKFSGVGGITLDVGRATLVKV